MLTNAQIGYYMNLFYNYYPHNPFGTFRPGSGTRWRDLLLLGLVVLVACGVVLMFFPPVKMSAEQYVQQGNKEYNAHEYGAAISSYSKAIEQRSSYADAW